jgi:hypothetical protein
MAVMADSRARCGSLRRPDWVGVIADAIRAPAEYRWFTTHGAKVPSNWMSCVIDLPMQHSRI